MCSWGGLGAPRAGAGGVRVAILSLSRWVVALLMTLLRSLGPPLAVEARTVVAPGSFPPCL